MTHKARRCAVHFGLAKTGTSAIQDFFFRNKKALLEKDRLLYPGEEIQHWHLASMFSATPESLIQIQRLEAHQPPGAFIERARRTLIEEIDRSRPECIFLSSEYLVAMTAGELRDLNRFLGSFAEEIVSIIYVRDPWSFSTSYLQEMIRNGYAKGSIAPGYAEGNVELIDKITANFPSKLIVRPYLGGTEFDSTTDICTLLGIDAANYQISPGSSRSNTGMSHSAACLLAELNERWPQFDTDGRFKFDGARDWCVEAILNAAGTHGPLALSNDRAEQIRMLSHRDVDRIHAEYMNGDDVFHRHFNSLKFFDIDDRIEIQKLSGAEIGRILLTALRELATRAHDNRVWACHAEAEAAYFCGMFLLHQGDPVQARQQFERVLEFRPGDPQALAQIASLDHSPTPVPAD